MKATRYNADLTLELVRAFIADYRKRDKRLYLIEALNDLDAGEIAVRMVALADDDTFWAAELSVEYNLCLQGNQAVYDQLSAIPIAADALLAAAEEPAD
jgi:hypothetical protein